MTSHTLEDASAEISEVNKIVKLPVQWSSIEFAAGGRKSEKVFDEDVGTFGFQRREIRK